MEKLWWCGQPLTPFYLGGGISIAWMFAGLRVLHEFL